MNTNGNISRRSALRVAAGSALAVGTGLSTLDAAAEKLQVGDSGPFRHSLCRWCFSKIPLPELAARAKALGFESIELLDPAEWPVVREAGLACAVANGTTDISIGFNRLENHARFVPSMSERLVAAARAGIPNVIVFSGNRNGISEEEGLENCAKGLRQIVGTAEKEKVTIVMELLNSRVNHPDYQCDRTSWGVELVKRVGSERFKLLYDIYHMQIMEGDVISTIRANHDYIAHYHCAGVPGRHDLDENQELNYGAISRAIAATGYRGFMTQEFLPQGDPFQALADAKKTCLGI
ncbi:MAG: TIM barrel protein [Opitutaceae bacterium]|nr:TIM barrel protein [Opitutaceae bacterium]